ncbi:MAG: ADP-ribosylglycohydrolase family protein [Alphaproteobacteria bacterium]
MTLATKPFDPIQNRAAGAMMGAFIGEALGVGPHWFYDLDDLQRHYGVWIDDYTRPLPGRYHDGLEPGDPSQSGLILALTIDSLLQAKGYDDQDFRRRFEDEIFAKIDGTPMSGPGGYTSQSVREAYRCWRAKGGDWEGIAGPADSTEALERTIALGTLYAFDLRAMSAAVNRNARLMQNDATVLSLTVAFNAVLALLIQGEALDGDLSGRLMASAKSGDLPFYVLTTGNLAPPKAGEADPLGEQRFASPDALLSPSYMARAAHDPAVRIEPAWKVSLVYGMPCAIYHMLPAAYYLAARFADDFESGVLHALNGGGQNQIRAMLTGTLIGAQTGIDGIPARFIDGLTDREALLSKALDLGALVSDAAQKTRR